MLSRKLFADLCLVLVVFLATAGLVEAQKIYQGYIDPAFVDFAVRSQTFQMRIADAVKSGQLSLTDADFLNKTIANLNAKASTTAETPKTNANLHAQLDKLSTEADLRIKNRQAVSSLVSDIALRKTSLQEQLTSSFISPMKKALLVSKLKRINAYESYLLEARGGLNYWQRKKIHADLDLLASQIPLGVPTKIGLLRN